MNPFRDPGQNAASFLFGEQSRQGRGDRPIILFAGVLIFTLLLFPPWVETLDLQSSSGRLRSDRRVGHCWIFSPPNPQGSAAALATTLQIDFGRLLTLAGAVAVAAGTGLWVLRAGRVSPP